MAVCARVCGIKEVDFHGVGDGGELDELMWVVYLCRQDSGGL